MTEEKQKEVKKENLDEELKSSQTNYVSSQKLPGEVDEKVKKDIDKTREKLEEFKKKVLKKYPFTLALGIIPPQAADKFDEELGLTEEERKRKPMHLTMIIPEDNYKDISKIKADLIKEIIDMKPAVWLNIITPVDIANYCLDSKFDIVEAISMSFPLYDKNILATFRISSIHKSLCLRKFEKYIYSYVIAGSLVRGEGKPTSDIDVYVIIDDTDVKRMSRVELKEKLRSIIYQYVAESAELSGVKTPLHVQVYLLTEFWEDVKDAAPVIFGFIRDGIPLYDRGGFLPWKLLLKMGKIKPSPEAIDRFMSMGDKTKEIVKNKMLDIVIGDIYWSTITPSQALLMLYGIPPTNTPETIREMKRIFVEKEKMLEKKYVDILEKICIKYYKGFEHGQIKEVSGKEIDELMKESEEYINRLKELREEIEKRAEERTLNETYDNVFKLLKNLFGNKSENELIRHVERDLVRKGKLDQKALHVLKELIDAKKRYKTKKKPTKYEIEDIRKNTTYLINHLIEYGQRCELHEIRKMQASMSFGKEFQKHGEIYLTNPLFILVEGHLFKIQEGKMQDASQEEFENIIGMQKGKPSKLKSADIEILKKKFGDFEISF